MLDSDTVYMIKAYPVVLIWFFLDYVLLSLCMAAFGTAIRGAVTFGFLKLEPSGGKPSLDVIVIVIGKP
jgi:hypothetical protein